MLAATDVGRGTSLEGGEQAGYDAVVVHYENDAVYGVVEGLGRQIPAPAHIWVVDNSGDLDRSRMASVSPEAVVLSAAGNRGYAAAVNSIRSQIGTSSRLLVVTHEVELGPGCAAALLESLRRNPSIGSAGPELRLTSDRDRVFSAGGTLDAWAWPRHTTQAIEDEPLRATSWIDGSVMLLRIEALNEVGWLDDGYFLYYEEIDLAVRLKRAGWDTVVVRGASAFQEPGGYPPFLAIRNRIRLVRRNPEVSSVPYLVLVARIVAEIVWVSRRRGLRSIRPSFRGLVAGLRDQSGRPRE